MDTATGARRAIATAGTTTGLRRRRACLGAVALLALPAARAQQGAMRKLGVFALLGDSIQVVQPEQSTGTRLPADFRKSLEVRDIGFDNIALRAVRDAADRNLPGVRLSLYKSTRAMTPAEQRAVADGATRAELPDWIVRSIEADKLTHVLLITRHRGEAVLQVAMGNAGGRGNLVEGIGFYLDPETGIRNETDKVESSGLLGAYVQVRLTLMDAHSGDVVRQVDIREGHAYGPRSHAKSAHPWDFLDSEQKASVLRELLEKAMAEKAPAVLKAG